jgi:transposase-like protein
MPMPACPECGTTLTVLVCGSGEHPTLYKCLLCRALFFGIESATRSRARVPGPGRDDLSRAKPRAAQDAIPG